MKDTNIKCPACSDGKLSSISWGTPFKMMYICRECKSEWVKTCSKSEAITGILLGFAIIPFFGYFFILGVDYILNYPPYSDDRGASLLPYAMMPAIYIGFYMIYYGTWALVKNSCELKQLNQNRESVEIKT